MSIKLSRGGKKQKKKRSGVTDGEFTTSGWSVGKNKWSEGRGWRNRQMDRQVERVKCLSGKEISSMESERERRGEAEQEG